MCFCRLIDNRLKQTGLMRTLSQSRSISLYRTEKSRRRSNSPPLASNIPVHYWASPHQYSDPKVPPNTYVNIHLHLDCASLDADSIHENFSNPIIKKTNMSFLSLLGGALLLHRKLLCWAWSQLFLSRRIWSAPSTFKDKTKMMCSSVEKDEGWAHMGANIPYTSMGREGGVIKGNIIEE